VVGRRRRRRRLCRGGGVVPLAWARAAAGVSQPERPCAGSVVPHGRAVGSVGGAGVGGSGAGGCGAGSDFQTDGVVPHPERSAGSQRAAEEVSAFPTWADGARRAEGFPMRAAPAEGAEAVVVRRPRGAVHAGGAAGGGEEPHAGGASVAGAPQAGGGGVSVGAPHAAGGVAPQLGGAGGAPGGVHPVHLVGRTRRAAARPECS